MKTEDLFKYGVTPKGGDHFGEKFIIDSIDSKGVHCAGGAFFAHGSYDIWQPPRTLFEDHSVAPTWGNLKKAAEAAGISDDMEFAVPYGFFSGDCGPASFSIETLREIYGKPKQYIMVR